MSCCGGNCGCGSACKCGSGCNGCGMYPDLSSGEIMLGSTASEMGYGYENMSVGGENDCKCGSNCTCDTCNCK